MGGGNRPSLAWVICQISFVKNRREVYGSLPGLLSDDPFYDQRWSNTETFRLSNSIAGDADERELHRTTQQEAIVCLSVGNRTFLGSITLLTALSHSQVRRSERF